MKDFALECHSLHAILSATVTSGVLVKKKLAGGVEDPILQQIYNGPISELSRSLCGCIVYASLIRTARGCTNVL